MRLLVDGDIEIDGRIAWGSNYTALGRVRLEDDLLEIVYKPQRGERPLWDFTSGSLCKRERAAYLISEAAGWGLIPTTILRDGPAGFGMVQAFIDHDPNIHYFTIQNESTHQLQFQQIALFDLLINNADRKSGHVILGHDQRIWAIDHGVSLHEQYKLRTVIWEFATQPISSDFLQQLILLKSKLEHGKLHDSLLKLLSNVEVIALQKRLDILINNAIFPEPGLERHYPWPPV